MNGKGPWVSINACHPNHPPQRYEDTQCTDTPGVQRQVAAAGGRRDDLLSCATGMEYLLAIPDRGSVGSVSHTTPAAPALA
jgi:hypothetical protein